MPTKWCRDCQRWVTPKRPGFDASAFISLLLIGSVYGYILSEIPMIRLLLLTGYYHAYWYLALLPAFLYILYHLAKLKTCQICNGMNFSPIEWIDRSIA